MILHRKLYKMNSKDIKQLFLDALRAAEEQVEKDLEKDEQSRKTSGYLISLFKLLGLDLIERLIDRVKLYIEGQIQLGIEKFAHGLSGVVAYLMMLLVVVITIFVGLSFGAVALSLFIGELLNSMPLGFLISGLLCMAITYLVGRGMFKREKLEKNILDRLDFGLRKERVKS